jgi:hypothetical protein
LAAQQRLGLQRRPPHRRFEAEINQWRDSHD